MNGAQLRSEPEPRLTVVASGALLLMWPCLLNWHPYLFWDTYSYFLQGRAYAVVLMAATGAGAVPPEAAPGWIGAAGRLLAEDASIRSIPYSLLLYVVAALGSFWTLAAINAATAAATIEVFLVRLCRLDLPRRLAVFGILAAISSLPWYATFLMPDLFAGLLILAVLLWALVPQRLCGTERIGLSLLALLAITFHSSHLLLAVVLVPLAVLLAPAARLAVAGRLAAIVVAGVAVLLTAAWLAFGRVEMAPNSPPFLLARAYADGSVRQYLETRCATESWVLCDRLDQLRDDANEFLWNKERSYWDWRDQRQRMRQLAPVGGDHVGGGGQAGGAAELGHHLAAAEALLGAARVFRIGHHAAHALAEADRVLQEPAAVRIERDARLGEALEHLPEAFQPYLGNQVLGIETDPFHVCVEGLPGAALQFVRLPFQLVRCPGVPAIDLVLSRRIHIHQVRVEHVLQLFFRQRLARQRI